MQQPFSGPWTELAVVGRYFYRKPALSALLVSTIPTAAELVGKSGPGKMPWILFLLL
jgi:hypothetical protein